MQWTCNDRISPPGTGTLLIFSQALGREGAGGVSLGTELAAAEPAVGTPLPEQTLV